MNRFTVIAGIGVLLVGGLSASSLGNSFTGLKWWIRLRFPHVPQMSTGELARLESEPPRKKPILLDVRTPAEYEVSHIAGAIRIDPDASAASVLPLLPHGRAVVAYCSVGYRSSALAQRLIAAGQPDVYDLEGSIFQWANEGRPLEQNGKTVHVAHPYDAKWGKYLNASHRADVPPIAP
jgi:rhodanese-related sulfurtransferase